MPGPWQAQEMVSFADDMLVMDFGVNGLWIFDGSWIQLSRWDARSMVAWGQNNLAVDFGGKGLWSYDGNSWSKIARGSL